MHCAAAASRSTWPADLREFPGGRLAAGSRGGAAGGTVLVVDERAAGSFTASGDETGRFFAAAGDPVWRFCGLVP